MTREEKRGLGGRIAAADDSDGMQVALERLDLRCGVVDAHALELLETRHVEPAIASPGGDDHRVRDDPRALREFDDVGVLLAERGGVRGHDDARAELLGLDDRARCELAARDPRREAEVILDPRRRSRLQELSRPLVVLDVEPAVRNPDEREEIPQASRVGRVP